MEETLNAIAARLTLHEFLLETVQANDLASLEDPRRECDHFCIQLLDRIRNRSTLPPGAEADKQTIDIDRKTIAAAERYCERLSERLDDVLRLRGSR